MASQPPKKPEEKQKTTGEDLKKVWSLGPLGEQTAKKTFDPAEAWLRKDDPYKKKGGKKRITRKRRSKKKWTSSATRKRN